MADVKSLTSSAKTQLAAQAQKAGDKLGAKLDSQLKDATGRAGNALSRVTLGLKKGGINDAVKSKVNGLLDAKLTKTLLQTGPKDELMTQDPLGLSDSNILNGLADTLKGFGEDLLSGVRKSSGIVADLGSLLKQNGDGFSLDLDNLKDRVTDALGGKNMLRGLSQDLQDSLLKNTLSPELYQTVDSVINNVSKSFNTDNVKDSRGLLDIVGQLTGDSKLSTMFDTGAEAQLMAGCCRQAIICGMPDAVDALVNKAKNSKAADLALQANINTAVEYCDLQTTELMIDKLGTSRVLADAPNAAHRMVRGYSIPTGVGHDGLDAEYTKLKATMDKLNPNWGTTLRDGEAVTDLQFFNQASADALKVLSRDPQWAVAVQLAQTYRTVNLLDVSRQQFPLAAI